MEVRPECCEQYWTSPRSNTLQNSSYMATNHPSRKLSQLDEPDMWDTATHGQAKARWPARTYIQQLCADTGCSLEDLPGAMDERKSGRSVLAVQHDDEILRVSSKTYHHRSIL